MKDYVKSRKHEWDEACFVPDLGDHRRFTAVVDRLFALQGESLTGGVVVRAFESFVPGGLWLLAGGPVDAFAKKIGVAVVPGVFLDHVGEDVAERDSSSP